MIEIKGRLNDLFKEYDNLYNLDIEKLSSKLLYTPILDSEEDVIGIISKVNIEYNTWNGILWDYNIYEYNTSFLIKLSQDRKTVDNIVLSKRNYTTREQKCIKELYTFISQLTDMSKGGNISMFKPTRISGADMYQGMPPICRKHDELLNKYEDIIYELIKEK